jgi:hypothetical protein
MRLQFAAHRKGCPPIPSKRVREGECGQAVVPWVMAEKGKSSITHPPPEQKEARYAHQRGTVEPQARAAGATEKSLLVPCSRSDTLCAARRHRDRIRGKRDADQMLPCRGATARAAESRRGEPEACMMPQTGGRRGASQSKGRLHFRIHAARELRSGESGVWRPQLINALGVLRGNHSGRQEEPGGSNDVCCSEDEPAWTFSSVPLPLCALMSFSSSVLVSLSPSQCVSRRQSFPPQLSLFLASAAFPTGCPSQGRFQPCKRRKTLWSSSLLFPAAPQSKQCEAPVYQSLAYATDLQAHSNARSRLPGRTITVPSSGVTVFV